MKKLASLFALAICMSAFSLSAQTTTIILLRHAEKDTATAGSAMMQANPPLSVLGMKRAAALPDLLSEYNPDAIFSTDFTRTKATVAPLAKKFNREVELYDPRQLNVLADRLKHMPGQTIVVAGHSNTTPALVNLLIGENKYPALDDKIYNRYWVVTITNGKAVAEERDY